jgi:hypothetical protein
VGKSPRIANQTSGEYGMNKMLNMLWNNSRNNSGITHKYYANSQGIMPESVKNCAGILWDNTHNRWGILHEKLNNRM